jgi:hypothetical protein
MIFLLLGVIALNLICQFISRCLDKHLIIKDDSFKSYFLVNCSIGFVVELAELVVVGVASWQHTYSIVLHIVEAMIRNHW